MSDTHIEEVMSYKTLDGRTFIKKELAKVHAAKLEDERKLAETVKKIKQLFEQELTLFENSTKEYEVNLEYDFWDDVSDALANESNVDITIADFKEYVSLVKGLLEDFHLEKVIKVVKKTLCKNTEEAV